MSSAASPASSSSNPQLAKPSISARKYIKWLKSSPADDYSSSASEPTSTLVLTSRTCHFVDIRILHGELSSTLFDTHDKTVPLDPSLLEWAFAGVSFSTPLPPSLGERRKSARSNSDNVVGQLSMTSGEDGQNAQKNKEPASSNGSSGEPKRSSSGGSPGRHTVWSHWVDSRTTDEVQDEGDCYPRGISGEETLERGRMVNPQTGKEQDYEELWRDFPVRQIATDREGAVSMVLRAENKDLGTKGMIIRVGAWCQGVVRVGSEIGVERWRFGSGDTIGPGLGLDEGSEDGGRARWERVVRVGELSMPCKVCWEREELKEGGEVTSGGLKWVVLEKHILN